MNIVLYDTVYPNPFIAYRWFEFNGYLDYYGPCRAYSTYTDPTWLNSKPSFPKMNTDFYSVLKDHYKRKPNHKGRIFRLTENLTHSEDRSTFEDPAVFYSIFLCNAQIIRRYAEQFQVPFVFTLYPNDSFNREKIDALANVFSSKQFSKVIVTKGYLKKRLLETGICPEEKIEYIYGGIVPPRKINKNRKYYGAGKDTFDVCYCAWSYSSGGGSKGYSRFVEVIKVLHKRYPKMRFHVVGGHTPDHCPLGSTRSVTKFYGQQDYNFFPGFYSKMDMIISPNDRHEGLPTGCCIDAAMNGALIVTTNIDNETEFFKDGENILFVSRPAPPEVTHDVDPDGRSYVMGTEEICGIVGQCYEDPKRLETLAVACQNNIHLLYNYDEQMYKRIKLLGSYL